MLLFTNARLIDGTGSAPQENTSVLVADGLIAGVGPEASFDVSPEVQRIDLGGKTLMPGMIDCHIHILYDPDPSAPPPRFSNIPIRDAAYWGSRSLLYGVRAARMTLEAGFTTVQDLAAPNEYIFPLRDSLAAGEHPGPRLLASGHCITLTGGHGTEYGGMAHVADGPDEVLKAVRKQVTAGADVIKYMGGARAAFSPPFRGREGYTTEEMRPGVEEAHRAGLRVAVHAHSSLQGIKNSILAGVDSIEHGVPIDDEALGWMAERGTYLCPTLSVYPASIECIKRGLWTYKGSEKQVYYLHEQAPKAIAAAKRHGVKVALGTDASMPLVMHGGNAREMEILVDYGLSTMEALVAGTRNAAENLGLLDKIGTVESGKIADLVVVDGDPLDDIRLLQQLECITLVMKEGNIVVDRRPRNGHEGTLSQSS
jgi:imidazolonepropionase-like amidohydrolase